MSLYNPDPEEWLALDVFFVLGLLGWLSIVLSGAATGFRLTGYNGYKRRTHFSGLVHPIFFSIFCFFAQCGAAVAAWLAWREGHRSDNIPPDPSSGTEPSNTFFFLENIFFFIYWIFVLLAGPISFVVMLECHMIWPIIIISVIILCLTIALVVMGFLIWSVIGGIYVIPLVFWLYATIVIIYFYKQYENGVCHLASHQLDCLSTNFCVETGSVNFNTQYVSSPQSNQFPYQPYQQTRQRSAYQNPRQ